MIDGPLRVSLAVLVIIGWLLALVWFSTSVVQIAVERTTSVTVIHCPIGGGVPCPR